MICESDYQLLDNGDAAITIVFDKIVGEELSKTIINISNFIKESSLEYIIEIIPAYQSITFLYDSFIISSKEFKNKLRRLLKKPIPLLINKSKEVVIPVCYDEVFAPDIDYLSDYCDLSIKNVIQLHTDTSYLVHMLGFLPGFLYLGGLHEKLSCPRKQKPKIQTAEGSVGIAGNQTGIYPMKSPGGWQIIGRSPIKMFEPQQRLAFIASPLDRIKFVAISKKEFFKIESEQQ